MNCLSVCGLRDGIANIGQFCIDQKLAAAWRGEHEKGLFFKSNAPLPFGNKMVSVRETISKLTQELPMFA
jgi:nitronate monooxygenase